MIFLIKRYIFAFVSIAWIFNLQGQNPADMPLRQVIELAQNMIGKGDFAGASPFLDELEIRFEDEKDPAVEKILQQFGFVRGIGYLQSFAKTGDMTLLLGLPRRLHFLLKSFQMTPKQSWRCKKGLIALDLYKNGNRRLAS